MVVNMGLYGGRMGLDGSNLGLDAIQTNVTTIHTNLTAIQTHGYHHGVCMVTLQPGKAKKHTTWPYFGQVGQKGHTEYNTLCLTLLS